MGQVTVGRPGAREVAGEIAFLLRRAFVLAVVFGLVLTLAAIAIGAPRQADDPFAPEVPGASRPEDATSGSLLVRRADGEAWAAAPVLSTEAVFRVSGTIARARVTQRFRNGTDEFVEGVYVFPLPESAAVDHLRLKVGDRLVEGLIRERSAARAEYQAAAEEGKRASLVEQQRPNVFTTRVANLPPGGEVSVEIEFQQALRFDSGEVRLRFPLVVGPRYVPGGPVATADDGGGWSPDTDRVPDASHVTPPVRLVSETRHNPVRIRVELDAGFPVGSLVSRYHPVLTESWGEGRYRVRLRDPLSPADRDFDLAWTPVEGTMPRGALFEETRDGARYVLLTLFPPAGPAVERSRLPRETVFVIDTSGSMEGPSIQQARRALLFALDRLRPGDRFNVIRFDSVTEPLFPSPVKAEAKTVELAKDWVAGLRANGGTEMRPALEAALSGGGADAGVVRQVVFLTDGSVANEDELLGVVRRRLGDARLFTVGIGSAPNGHFMTKAAELGHGTFTYVGDVREVEEKVGQLFARLESPLLTSLDVRWPAGVAVEAWPSRPPDLYAGEPLVLSARLRGACAGPVVVSGRRGGEEWRASLPLDGGRKGEGLGVLWARRKVEALLDSVHDGADPSAVKAQVVALGLEHHLVTKHTSLVAVDVTPARPADAVLETRPVPVNLPHGWSSEAVFGELPQTATPLPLHAAWFALSLSAAAALWLADRRWRAGARS